MCLNRRFGQPIAIEEATEDIIVYKTGRTIGESFAPSYYGMTFAYRLNNETAKEEIRIDNQGGMWEEVNRGYHSYAFVSDADREREGDEVLGLFVIPKGATIAKGDQMSHEGYASSTLIYKGIFSYELEQEVLREIKEKKQDVPVQETN